MAKSLPIILGKLRKKFNRDALDPSTPLSFVEYADGHAEIFGAEEHQINGVMMSHFSSRIAVAHAFELADATNALIFWPGEPPFMAVTKAETLARLPDVVKQEQIAIVKNVDELIVVIGLIWS